MRLLVIEDDSTMQRFLKLILEEEGYVVDATAVGDEGRVLALTNEYDGIVCDLSLPDMTGLQLIQTIRSAENRVPILVFSGRHDREDVIAALDAGADDYLTKPTDGSLIRARIRALVRRGQRETSRPAGAGPLLVGNVSLNIGRHRVLVGGIAIPLTPKEVLLLQQLMLHPGEIVQRSELLEKVWDMNFDPGSKVVDTHVSRLRTKLHTAGATAKVRAVRGVGYVFEQDEGGSQRAG
jgi:two-component system OmpR family response regulator